MEIITLSGKGKLSAFSVIYIAPTAMIQLVTTARIPIALELSSLRKDPGSAGRSWGWMYSNPKPSRWVPGQCHIYRTRRRGSKKNLLRFPGLTRTGCQFTQEGGFECLRQKRTGLSCTTNCMVRKMPMSWYSNGNSDDTASWGLQVSVLSKYIGSCSMTAGACGNRIIPKVLTP